MKDLLRHIGLVRQDLLCAGVVAPIHQRTAPHSSPRGRWPCLVMFNAPTVPSDKLMVPSEPAAIMSCRLPCVPTALGIRKGHALVPPWARGDRQLCSSSFRPRSPKLSNTV